MATVVRRPLSSRQPEQPVKIEKLIPVYSVTRPSCFTTPTSKRPRSPDPDDATYSKRCRNTFQPSLLKLKAPPHNNTHDNKDPTDRQRQKEQRQLANQEFVTKYTKAFPTFVFFFDERDGGKHQMESGILALGAV